MLRQHLVHASAEINSAIKEGYYCFMLPPDIAFDTAFDEKGDLVVMNLRWKLNYKFKPIDSDRTVRVDLRDEMSRRRNPDYQPPGAS